MRSSQKMVRTNRCGFKIVPEKKTTLEGCRMIFSGVIFGLGYADRQYPVLIPRLTSEDLQVLGNATSIEMRGPVFQMMYRVTEAQGALAGYGISNQIIDIMQRILIDSDYQQKVRVRRMALNSIDLTHRRTVSILLHLKQSILWLVSLGLEFHRVIEMEWRLISITILIGIWAVFSI